MILAIFENNSGYYRRKKRIKKILRSYLDIVRMTLHKRLKTEEKSYKILLLSNIKIKINKNLDISGSIRETLTI